MLRTLAKGVLRNVPFPLQNLYYTGRGVYHLVTELGPDFRRALRGLGESDRWDAGRIREYQDACVRRVVRNAYENVPFYREWFDAAGVRPGDIRVQEDLRRLPLLTKQIVRERQRDMVSRRYRRGLLTVRGTSGTTGTAVVVYHTPACRALQRALTYRHRGRFGIGLRDAQLRFTSHLGLLSHRDKPPFWWHNYTRGQVVLSPTHLVKPEHVAIVADWMTSRKFAFYQGWPSAMLIVANYLLERGRSLDHPPRLIDYSSESLHSGSAERLRRAFGNPTIAAFYGMTEAACTMSQCEHGRLHLDFENGCIETMPAGPGAGPNQRRLVVTGFANDAMPFIRYDVGDLGTLADAPCPCGRATPSFTSIDGRQDAYVRTPDGGAAFGLNIHLPSAQEVQIYQRTIDAIELRVVPGRDYDPSEEAETVRRLRDTLGERIRIDIVKMDRIERSKSGKFRAVVSELEGAAGAGMAPAAGEIAAGAR
ncbi:MAG: Phenylacetate-coenzyme A ligase [Phycisphaerae bacterium]|nr:Phenylacetate-coenzyme A ligase [Phycisphaerae bacterium]